VAGTSTTTRAVDGADVTDTAVASGVLPAASVTSAPSTARVVVDVPATVLLAPTGVYRVADSIAGGLGFLVSGVLLTILGLRRRRRNA
ncbi:MAG TPA: hypothetical protein VK537_02995, partial [Galbitalea sp.]|nr:hypothetical protein [Galbitalea sp.]